MKKLLLLTDFTENSAHAAVSACNLCIKLNTDMLLYHSVQYMPIVPDFANGSAVTETNSIIFNDCQEKLQQELSHLEEFIAEAGSTTHPKLSFLNGEGNLGDNVRTITGREDIHMVVMGGRAGGSIDHLLTGSETTGVINHALKPVLIVPFSAELNSLKKIVMATDFNAADIEALDFLSDLAEDLNAQVEVVHVVKPGSVITDLEPELLFRRHLNTLNPERVTYRQLTGTDIGKLLSQHCHNTHAGLLAVTHQRHGWLSRLLGRSESETLLGMGELAVLVFPPLERP